MESRSILRYEQQQATNQTDWLSVEAPLEIQLVSGRGKERRRSTLAITMRSPGHDDLLALGFLFTEGVLPDRATILECAQPQRLGKAPVENVIEVHLHPDLEVDLAQLNRHFYTSSSCGVCGKTSIDNVTRQITQLLPVASPRLRPELFYQLPEKLKARQPAFRQTGGQHAVALFNTAGDCLACFEDVGRHNAMDKLIGSALMQDLLPLHEHIVMVSGRASFELVQKALMAGVTALAAVGAPSSLAVELADAHGMTLVGFVREHSLNVYSGAQRFKS